MKKIILGCAAVLLSIGLLAGCGNKEDEEPPITEAVTISVDSSATVVVGESLELSYTVSPEKAEVIAASDNEAIVTAVAQSGTLYLEGVAEGSAIVTLVGTYEGYATANKNINVSVVTEATEKTEPGEEEPNPVITLTGVPATLDLIESGSSETIVPVVVPEEADIDYEITEVVFTNTDPADGTSVISVTPTDGEYVVAPVAQGSANIVFTASLEGYDTVTATTAVTVHESGWVAPFASYTVKVTLTTSQNAAFPDPGENYALWVASDYDSADEGQNWGSAHAMTFEGSGVFTYKYEGVPTWDGSSNNYSGGIYAGSIESVNWSHQFGSITITDPTSGSGDVVGAFSIQSGIGDTWEGILPLGNGTTDFYIVVFEGCASESYGSSTLNSYTAIAGEPAYFDGTDGSNSSTSLTSGTTSSNQPYVYNATKASAGSMDRSPSWVSMHDGSWTETTKVALEWYMDFIPDTDAGTYAVFCFVLDTTLLPGQWVEGVATSGITGVENGWVTGVTSIDTFLNSITGTVACASGGD